MPAGGYLLVWADNEANQNSSNRADLHVSFALTKGGEAIGLFAGDGTAIDAIGFGAQTTDVSEGRFPDGAWNVYAMPTRTPRAANVLPKTPCVLAAISNRVVTLGQTLSFTVQATDADIQTQSLSFSLSNAPVGAAIGGSSGVFTWTPSIAPATNTFTVGVSDDGSPAMTDAELFTVIVAPRPESHAHGVQDGNFIFDWATVAGQSFRVESTEDLATPVWVSLGDVLLGTGAPLSSTNELEGSPQRYFRVQVQP